MKNTICTKIHATLLNGVFLIVPLLENKVGQSERCLWDNRKDVCGQLRSLNVGQSGIVLMRINLIL